jgi:predicted dienelactone hydrolase
MDNMIQFLRARLSRIAVVMTAGLLLLAINLATNAAPATASTRPYLLRPTGPHHVGTTSIYLKDTSRPDPWAPETNTRELMVNVWYPTNSTGGNRAQYMTPEESRLTLEHMSQAAALPTDTLATVQTNAYLDAPPAGRAHSLPLVVLSPGYTQARSSLSGLAEDLASHGYVVVAIDHTYETYAVTFPDGRIATCLACDLVEDDAFFRKLYESRAADVSFVLDQLTGPNPKWRGSGLIDAAHIGMSGHSAGGASSIAAMLHDPRIDAGIDMDGDTRDIVPASGLDRPFMFLGTPAHAPGGPEASWDHDWNLMTGWRRWLVVAGTQHASFNDVSLLAEQFGIDIGATTTGTRSMEITRRYNLALFDLHLRHQPQPLLDGASACYPEVTIAAT